MLASIETSHSQATRRQTFRSPVDHQILARSLRTKFSQPGNIIRSHKRALQITEIDNYNTKTINSLSEKSFVSQAYTYIYIYIYMCVCISASIRAHTLYNQCRVYIKVVRHAQSAVKLVDAWRGGSSSKDHFSPCGTSSCRVLRTKTRETEKGTGNEGAGWFPRVGSPVNARSFPVLVSMP